MTVATRKLMIGFLLFGGGLGGCATNLDNIVSSPRVELRDVQVMGLGFSGQTFLLSFDIRNPNPFPLPVSNVSYGVRLDEQRFASGTTTSEFSIPAEGDAEFAITVELDLLQTAPRLLSIVRQAQSKTISYELEGELAIDIPFTPPVAYRNKGTIRIGSGAF